MKFRRPDGTFDVDRFNHAVDIVFLAQEIIVGPSSYPTEQIGKNARAFRQLGLGYANLGAYLMANGFAYDSDEGRGAAAAITALMTGRGYLAVGEDRRRARPVRPLRREPRGAQQRHAHAPRRVVRGAGRVGRRQGAAGRGARDLERGGRARRAPRLPQRPGDGARRPRGASWPAPGLTSRGLVRLRSLGRSRRSEVAGPRRGGRHRRGSARARRSSTSTARNRSSRSRRSRGYRIQGTPTHRIKVVDERRATGCGSGWPRSRPATACR